MRHCVFVLGTAGAAKTELWKTLAAAQTHLKIGGGRTQYATLNPKAVTSNDLYGYVHPVTKEPYDGIIAKIMRDFSGTSRRSSRRRWRARRATAPTSSVSTSRARGGTRRAAASRTPS